MPRFPGYGFPFQYYKPYSKTNNYNTYKPQAAHSYEPPIPPLEIKSPPKAQEPPKSLTPVWFDLFGIKLYFDDVLILSLLFFLYKEEVKDEGLFLALVLLLIS